MKPYWIFLLCCVFITSCNKSVSGTYVYHLYSGVANDWQGLYEGDTLYLRRNGSGRSSKFGEIRYTIEKGFPSKIDVIFLNKEFDYASFNAPISYIDNKKIWIDRDMSCYYHYISH